MSFASYPFTTNNQLNSTPSWNTNALNGQFLQPQAVGYSGVYPALYNQRNAIVQKTPPQSPSNGVLYLLIIVVTVMIVGAVLGVTLGLTLGSGGSTQNPATQTAATTTTQTTTTQAPSIDGDIFNTGRCGGQPALNRRIYGGSLASTGEWPWMGSLRNAQNRHICAASLLSNRWIVTAAHCVDPAVTPDRDLKSVVFGDVLISSNSSTSSYIQSSTFLSTVVHPQWVPTNISFYDIALVNLATPIQTTNLVRPICLSTLVPEWDMYNIDSCYVIGWGQTSSANDSYPDALQELKVSILNTTECARRANGTALNLCDDGVINTGPCFGDSGGPLACRSKSDNYWHQVGIVNSGVGCGLGIPALYTPVTQYVEWIKGIVGV